MNGLCLGVDIGVSNVGWATAFIDGKSIYWYDCGTIVTAQNKKVLVCRDIADRTLQVVKQIESKIDMAEKEFGQLTYITSEALSFLRDAKTSAMMGHCVGALAVLSLHRLADPTNWVFYQPMYIKRCVTGDKTADKKVVIQSMVSRWGMDMVRSVKLNVREHAADAGGAIVTSVVTYGELGRLVGR